MFYNTQKQFNDIQISHESYFETSTPTYLYHMTEGE